jgi:hypothetical protein
MDNRRMGVEGSAVVELWRNGARPMEVARAFAGFVNQIILATEWLARCIILGGLTLVLYYAADREPPFAVISTEPAEVRAGEFVTLRSAVYRDIERGCNTEFSRFLWDSHGARFDLGTSKMSAQAIAAMDRQSPGQLVMSVHVPSAVSPGPARLQTVILYRCNRTHAWWPIESVADMPFTVLP